MPAFLVHGVPDTEHLWDGVRSHLTRTDIIASSMPGFGTPLPDGFDCTMDAYAAWLIARVEGVGEPVDIVGHDWGSSVVWNIASHHPEKTVGVAFEHMSLPGSNLSDTIAISCDGGVTQERRFAYKKST